MKKLVLSFTAVFLLSMATSCGPTYVRGSDKPDLDEYAMSTGLDKVDLQKLFDENFESLMGSAVVASWRGQPQPPVVSVFPIANETSEHIRDQLNALLAKMETQLINQGVATIVDHERQSQLIEEVKRQQGGAFNEAQSAQVGRQLGAQYFLTGKVYDSAEKAEGERRVQYFLFMKIVEIETGIVRWQNEANLTKGLVS